MNNKILIVSANYYKEISKNLELGAINTLKENGYEYEVINAPGCFEIPYLIKKCEKLNLKKLLLEVSQSNVTAERFYSRFDFSTVGIRKNYYKDGSHALLKEKKLTTK